MASVTSTKASVINVSSWSRSRVASMLRLTFRSQTRRSSKFSLLIVRDVSINRQGGKGRRNYRLGLNNEGGEEGVEDEEGRFPPEAKLETDLQAVNQQVGGLKTQIGSLEQGIETTQKKLAAAVGDRAFLLRELKRMQDEKAELEKHLNNLEYVRAQYKKLKSEWAASERLRMIREGIGYYGHKNGNVRGVTSLGKLARRDNKPPTQPAAETDVNPDQLNVELKSDGTVTIVQPDGKTRIVVPEQTKTPVQPNPSEKEEPKPAQPIKPKGVVTPAPESILPKLKTNPAVAPKPKSETPAATPASTEAESLPKPISPAVPKSEKPASKPAVPTTPKAETPASKPALKADTKPTPAVKTDTKPTPKPVAPTPKPAPANP